MTGDTALRLGHFFGTSPEFWMNLQKLYELRLRREIRGNNQRLADAHQANEKAERRFTASPLVNLSQGSAKETLPQAARKLKTEGDPGKPPGDGLPPQLHLSVWFQRHEARPSLAVAVEGFQSILARLPQETHPQTSSERSAS